MNISTNLSNFKKKHKIKKNQSIFHKANCKNNKIIENIINNFLIKPKDYVKGTKMAYMGLKKEKDRASVILYLNEQSDSPLSLP